MIAMATINKPKLLIADEPTTALDVSHTDRSSPAYKTVAVGNRYGHSFYYP